MSNRRLIARSVLALVVASGSSALAQPVMRIYDARDLAAALPRGEGGNSAGRVPFLSDIPIISRFYVANSDQAGAAAPQGAAGSATDVIVSRLCSQLHLESERLMDGVYVVKGENADQDQFASLMEKTRALYLGAYEVEVVCYVVPAANAPGIGGAADVSAPLMRTRQTVVRRVHTPIGVTEMLSYVQDWTPVVGNDAVGYDPQISQVERGLSVVVLVGSGPDARADGKTDAKAEGPIMFAIHGQISDVKIELFKAAEAQPPGTTLEIGLPAISTRSISSEASLSSGKPTVLAVVPGFKAGEAIVVGATVREIR